MSGSVDDRDLAALGPSLPRPRSGRGKAGPWGKRGRPFRPAQSLSVPWITFVLGRGAASTFSPVPRFQGRGWKGGRGDRGAEPGPAALGAGEAGADGARAVQLRPEAAANSAQSWAPLAPLGPAGLVWALKTRGDAPGISRFPRERSRGGSALRTPPCPAMRSGLGAPPNFGWVVGGGDKRQSHSGP